MSKEKDILILILNDGTQLLAAVSEGSGAYLCENVLQLVEHIDPNDGQLKRGMQPFPPHADMSAGIAIPTHMAIIAIPNNDIKNFYSEKFGLIITPPEPKIVLA